MTSQKRDRLVAAVTVSVVLLLVILVGVMVYQLVTIFALKDDKTNLQEEVSQIIERTESMEDAIEKYQTIEWLQNYIFNNWDTYKEYFIDSGSED